MQMPRACVFASGVYYSYGCTTNAERLHVRPRAPHRELSCRLLIFLSLRVCAGCSSPLTPALLTVLC